LRGLRSQIGTRGILRHDTPLDLALTAVAILRVICPPYRHKHLTEYEHMLEHPDYCPAHEHEHTTERVVELVNTIRVAGLMLQQAEKLEYERQKARLSPAERTKWEAEDRQMEAELEKLRATWVPLKSIKPRRPREVTINKDGSIEGRIIHGPVHLMGGD
jgi:hypothetical protein